MKTIHLLATLFLLAGCAASPEKRQVDAADYPHTFYSPAHTSSFSIRQSEADTTLLMLEVYKPDTMRVAIPAGGFSRLGCMSSTYVGMLDAVAADDKVVAASSKDYLTNARVKARAIEVGYEGAMDYESLIAANVDLMLIYGIGGESPLAAKFDELGIPYVYISDFEEQDPLGRAEWTVALAALAGVDARDFIKEVSADYQPMAGSVPVMINSPYGGSWFIPGRDSYMSRLIADAGGQLAVAQQPGAESKPVDMEVAVPALNAARIWLNPGQVTDAASARRLAPHAHFSGQIWNQTPDFYESGAAWPGRVLRELQLIMAGNAPEKMQYFVKLK